MGMAHGIRVPSFVTAHSMRVRQLLMVNGMRSRSLLAAHGMRLRSILAPLVVGMAAIGLRLWIGAQPGLGHDGDLALFTRWMRGLQEHGLGGFYAAEKFCDYPPLMLLLLQSASGVIFALFKNPDEAVLRFGIKALAGLGDLAIGLLLFHEGRRLLGARAGALAGGLYLLNPVSIYDSAVWGQVDSIYTAFLVGSFVLLRRGRWAGAGFAGALGLAAKFQAIAILPLVLFEAYRLARVRGLLRTSVGGIAGAILIASPFLFSGTASEMVDRAYVRVVGQYHKMSNNAYNIWYLVGEPDASDLSQPQSVLRAVAGGRTAVDAGDSWLLGLTWRRISLLLFALSVAVVLSLYARRPGPVARYGAAGLLALCFFLFPTEMHERYAYPAVAFLALWAAASPFRERVYWAISIAILLNLVTVLPAHSLAPQIAALHLGVFAVLLGALAVARLPEADAVPSEAEASARSPEPNARPFQEGPVDRLPFPIRGFQCGTAIALLAALCLAGAVFWSGRGNDDHVIDEASSIWLSDLTPELADQGWKNLARDRSVEGGPLRIGNAIYLRGVGTHAPATLVYVVPGGCERFEAIAGIGHAALEKGSVVLRVELDGVPRFESPILTPDAGAIHVQVDVREGEVLTIHVDPTHDGRSGDHVDLALARFVRPSLEGVVVQAGEQR